jgi:nucleotide-binding universal stress UspA family protein
LLKRERLNGKADNEVSAMYENILLAVALQGGEELSPHALAVRDVAIPIAAEGPKSVCVLTVYNLERIDGHHELIPTIDEINVGRSLKERENQGHEAGQIQKIEEQVHSTMDRFLVEFHNKGVKTQKLIKEGNPRELIVDTAVEMGADLIIIGAHARRSFLDIILGGTAQAVVGRAPCSVIMVKPKP